MISAALAVAGARVSFAADAVPAVLPAAPVAAVESPAPASDAVLVTVNGESITRGDLDREMDAALARFAGRVPAEQIAAQRQRMEKDALDAMVVKRMLSEAIAS